MTIINAPKDVRHFDKPTLVRHSEATRFLWGDNVSQQVPDLIYGRSETIGALVFKLKPGGFFLSSNTWKAYFDQHRFYYVLSGALTIHDPESGEILTARKGEALYWRGPKWHFGYNFSEEECAVLDWYAPQERPMNVSEVEFGKTKPEVIATKAGREELLCNWPDARAEVEESARRSGGLVVTNEDTALNFVFGEQSPVLEKVFVSSSEFTAGTVLLTPATTSITRENKGEKIIFNLEGETHIYLPERYEWFEMNKWDVLYLPAGMPHQYFNNTGLASKFAFMAVPAY